MKKSCLLILILIPFFISCVKEETPPKVSSCGTLPQNNDFKGLKLSFPTVFTPNGDGINDVFFIKNFPGATSKKITVSNSSNVKVFETTPYYNDFSGKDMDGNALPAGVYSYKLELDNETYDGYVTILYKNDDFCLKNCSIIATDEHDPVLTNNICK